MDREALVHFVGGAAGGTAGTALTCPLEVIKTRLQSSKHGFDSPMTQDSGAGRPSTSNSSQGKGVSSGSDAYRKFVSYNPHQRSNLFKSRFCHLVLSASLIYEFQISKGPVRF